MECTTSHLDRVFAALSDRTRREILIRLARGEASVAELAEPFAQSQPTISSHLRALEEAGLVRSRKVGNRRPRSLVVERLQEVETWLAPFRAQWEQRLDRLEGFLASEGEANHG